MSAKWFVLSFAAIIYGTVRGGDWPMLGGDPARNAVSQSATVPLDFDLESKKSILWTAKLGSQTYGSPVLAGNKIFIGTNNGGEYRPKHVRKEKDNGDRGVLLCLDRATGKFVWQLTRQKLEEGRSVDWPDQGIASSPCVEGDRLYVVTNRCELMCLDVNGLVDGKNDGPFTAEIDADKEDADIVWSLDMYGKLGVRPRYLANSSPVVFGDFVFVLTGNGVDETGLAVANPEAPSFLCVDKKTGAVVWQDSSPSTSSLAPPPSNTILEGQWSSPAVGMVKGVPQVCMSGGDGCLYTFEASAGVGGKPKLLWKCDLNPKDAKLDGGGKGERNQIVATPIYVGDSVLVGVGRDPEKGDGVGRLVRIDATKTGDITESGKQWVYGGVDDKGESNFRRTLSSAVVHGDLVFAVDLSGFFHCVDWQTGKRYWQEDLLAAVWGSPVVVAGKVLVCTEDGDLIAFEASKEKKPAIKKPLAQSIYGSPTIVDGKMYVANRSTLIALGSP